MAVSLIDDIRALRKDLETVAVTRTKNTEMPPVDRQYPGDIQPLGHGDDAGVDEISVVVAVIPEDLRGSGIIVWLRRFKDKV